MRLKKAVPLLALVATLVGLAPATAAAGGNREPNPLVIGHRGASGYLPEHTLQSYALAIKQGADYVEPDLVATKDGHLIARHEPDITLTTDVRAKFPRRETTKTVDGVRTTGFFASDFTLAEIKTLRAVQTFPERPQRFNGRFKIPTLEEVIDLVKHESRKRDRRIGIYPETKHPTYHEDLGLPLEPRLVKILKHAGWDSRRDPVFIQSFEQSNLKWLNRRIGVRLVQLVDANDVLPDGRLEYVAPYDRPYDWTVSGDPELRARTFGFFATDDGLEEISTYADGIGPWKRYIVSTLGTGPDSSRTLARPTDLIDRAHAHGLQIHTWTFRNEQSRLVSNYMGNPINEYLQFYELGIDGVFSDFPDTAVTARELLRIE
jgi:glycerophosphoryl diester phosphodiesterase